MIKAFSDLDIVLVIASKSSGAGNLLMMTMMKCEVGGHGGPGDSGHYSSR